MTKEKNYRYSEIFYSIQGEGKYTGVNTAWIRLWGCNFTCSGFSQESKDPKTWENIWDKIDLTDITTLEELPVVEKGCDSSYSWSKKFRHLAHLDTAKTICEKIQNVITNEYNPAGRFTHQTSGQETHMAFTGGEPMMNQGAILSILQEFQRLGNKPKYVTIETNGTQKLKSELGGEIQGIDDKYSQNRYAEWFWSVSPKLSASGEAWEDAIKPDVLLGYKYVSNHGQLKYVVDGTQECWDEVDRATEMYRKVGVNWPVWIMPVGARVEEQEEIAGKISEQAMARGYYVSARVHCYLWGNQIGT